MNRNGKSKSRRDKKRKGRKKRTASDERRNGTTNKKVKVNRRKHHSYTLSRTTNNPFNLASSNAPSSLGSLGSSHNLALIQTNSGTGGVSIPSLMQANTALDVYSPPIATISPRQNDSRNNQFTSTTTRSNAASVDNHVLHQNRNGFHHQPVYGQNSPMNQSQYNNMNHRVNRHSQHSQHGQYPQYPQIPKSSSIPSHTRKRTVTPPHLKHKPLPSLPPKSKKASHPSHGQQQGGLSKDTRSKSVHFSQYTDGSISDTTTNHSNGNPFQPQSQSLINNGNDPSLKRKRSNSSPDVISDSLDTVNTNSIGHESQYSYPAPPPLAFGIQHQHSVPMQGMHYSEPFQVLQSKGSGYQSDPNMQKSNSNPFMRTVSNNGMNVNNNGINGMNAYHPMNGGGGGSFRGTSSNGMQSMNGIRFNVMNGVNGMNTINNINGVNNIQNQMMSNNANSSTTHFINYPTSDIDTSPIEMDHDHNDGHDAEDEKDESSSEGTLREEDEPDLSSPDLSECTDSTAYTTELCSPSRGTPTRGKSVGDALISAFRPTANSVHHHHGYDYDFNHNNTNGVVGNESNGNVSVHSQNAKTPDIVQTTNNSKNTKNAKHKKREFRRRGRRLSDSEVVTPHVNSPYHPNNRQQPSFSQYKRRKEKISADKTQHLVLENRQSGDSDKESSMPPPSPAVSAVSSLRTPNPTTPNIQNMPIPPQSVPNTLQVNPLRLLVSKSADYPTSSSVTPSPQPIPIILLPGQDLNRSNFEDKRISASYSGMMHVNALYGVSPDDEDTSSEGGLFQIDEGDEDALSPPLDQQLSPSQKRAAMGTPTQKRSTKMKRRNSDSVVWTPVSNSLNVDTFDSNPSPKKRKRKRGKKKSLHQRFLKKYGRSLW